MPSATWRFPARSRRRRPASTNGSACSPPRSPSARASARSAGAGSPAAEQGRPARRRPTTRRSAPCSPSSSGSAVLPHAVHDELRRRRGIQAAHTLFGSIFGLGAGEARLAAVIAPAAVLLTLGIARPLLFASVPPRWLAPGECQRVCSAWGFVALLGVVAAEATVAVGALPLLGYRPLPAAAHRTAKSPFWGPGWPGCWRWGRCGEGWRSPTPCRRRPRHRDRGSRRGCRRRHYHRHMSMKPGWSAPRRRSPQPGRRAGRRAPRGARAAGRRAVRADGDGDRGRAARGAPSAAVSRASVYRILDELEQLRPRPAGGDRPGDGPLRACV